MPWVVTNPIYVFDRAEQEARAERASWPAPVAAPAATSAHRRLRGPNRLRSRVSMPSRASALPVLDPHAGPDGRGAARLPFDWAWTAPSRPFTWCALRGREAPRPPWYARAWPSGSVPTASIGSGCRSAIRTRHRPTRERSRGSPRCERRPEWHSLAVAFADLRSNQSGYRWPPRPRQGAADRVRRRSAAVKRARGGTIWLDEVGVY
jgi:hypothetical protein